MLTLYLLIPKAAVMNNFYVIIIFLGRRRRFLSDTSAYGPKEKTLWWVEWSLVVTRGSQLGFQWTIDDEILFSYKIIW